MIEFIGVTKTYSERVALKSVSFTVERGTACGYIGPNGAGKTTTAKIIVGLESPDSGEVKIFNESPRRDSNILNLIGYVPESPRLYESLTPIETIAFAALLRRFDKKRALKRLEFLAELLSFKDFLKKPLRHLSKGTKQKVVISMALTFNPKLLVLDEPTDGLDVQSVVSLKHVIKSFTAHGGVVFYSSHFLEIVENICDKVYLINSGSIVGQYDRTDFAEKRGYLENVLLENIGGADKEELIDAFIEDSI
jgi:ABC-2 type transport system ATP-binding protein